MKKALLTTRNFLIAVMTTFIAASVLHSQFVLAELTAIGINVSMSDRITMTLSDVSGLLVGYGAIITLSLLLGFLIMQAINKWLFSLPDWRFAIGGFIAIATALLAMQPLFNITLIASARSELGFLSQCFAGAIGGLVYARIYKAA
ncbi:MAG: hypothetical protein GJ680_08590 [Alteromonadaceae bacterium]|nr:hypothetical protein [Alteromonadaceae bacterium]